MKWLASPFILSLCTVGFVATSYAAPQISKTPVMQQSAKKAETFKSFTGKVLANKVRIRSKADLESHIVRQVNKNDLLLVVAEDGDFYAVQPPKETKDPPAFFWQIPPQGYWT